MLLLFSSISPLYAQQNEVQKILASDGVANNYFGRSVAVSGNTAIVGADAFYNSSAYIWEKQGSTWQQTAKLLPTGGAGSFGYSVSISGNTAIVGATDNAAFIFEKNGSSWQQVAKLVSSDKEYYDQFGFAVAISGNTAVVGAYRNNYTTGSAYVFEKNGTTWQQVAKLLAADRSGGDSFGYSVAVSGSTILLGAPYDTNIRRASGSAYIFTKNGTIWQQATKLLASDEGEGNNFGSSVAISGSTAVVGTPYDDDNGRSSGSAYVFQKVGTAWSQMTKLLPADGAVSDNFGYSVAISNTVITVGAWLDSDNGQNSGSAYIFGKNGAIWQETTKLLPSDGAAHDSFGSSVAVSGTVAIVGAYGNDDQGNQSGSAYFFAAGSSSCVPSVVGDWLNTDANTHSITRVKVDFNCQSQNYTVRLWGKCHPSDCDWGAAAGTALSSGVVKAFYDQGFAQRHVYLGYSSSYPSSPLWVYIFNDFTDPNRQDYVIYERFKN